MNLAVILFLAGAVVMLGLWVWARQRLELSGTVDLEQVIENVPAFTQTDAVLVARDHGQLIHANERARAWLNMNGGTPHLERVARMASPADNLLDLFAAEGQASFKLGERWVEAASHRIPTGTETRTVIVMRELSSTTSHPEALDLSLAMKVINQLGEAVQGSSSVVDVLQALLNVIKREVPFDAGEICLWDAESQTLEPQGYVGEAGYVIALAAAGGRYALGDGITGWVAKYRKPVLVTDRRDPSAVQPMLNQGFNSFLAVPLMLGDSFVGTLELASLHPGWYDRGHLALLQAISSPVSVTIHNARLHAEQQQRIEDLATLQRIARRGDGSEATDSRPIYAALAERVATFMDANMCGILVYDDEQDALLPELPFHGLPDAVASNITLPLSLSEQAREIWQERDYWLSNDLKDEPLVDTFGLRPAVSVAGIHNTLWMPLDVGGQRIGVLAVSNRPEGGFNESRDVQNLTILASQVAIILESVRLLQREKRLDDELAGLQEITHAIGALTQEGEFYGEITERIARLMDITTCGILLLDESGTRLSAKLPFYGVRDELIVDYGIPLQPGSVMAQLWEEEDYWISNRVRTDPLVYEAGLDDHASAVGVQKTLFAPLMVGGRRMGVVQVSDKHNGEDFNNKDARLLQIFAAQTAAIIENARLFREAQRSADEAQGLRRVAELAGAVLTTKETFAPVLSEIARYTRSEIVFINVLNQQTASLITYPRYVHGHQLTEPIVQDIYVPGFENSVAIAREPYIGNDVQNDERVLASYQNIAQRMNIRKAILVPLVVGDQPLGELGVANRSAGHYDRADLDVMRIIASQIASALDRLLLYEKTGQNLERRSRELDAISHVSNALTMTLDLEPILNTIRTEATQATGADDATVAMLMPRGEGNMLPQLERRYGGADFPPGLTDIELEAINRTNEPVLITDYEFSTLTPAPRGARAAIATPVLYLDTVVGVLQVYHHDVNAFDDRAAAFLTTLATKASLGYGNFVRYQEQLNRSDRLRRRVDQLNRIFELGHMFHGQADPVMILEAIAYSVQQSVGFDTVVMTLVNEQTGRLERITHAGMPLDLFETTRANTMPLETLDKLLRDDYRISESFFYPLEKVGDWYVEHIDTLSTAYDGNRSLTLSGRRYWRDGDMLLVTMRGASGAVIGVMSLDRPHDNLRPEQPTVEVLEIFAHQASTAIENIRLFRSSETSAEREARLSEIAAAAASSFDMMSVTAVIAEGVQQLAGTSWLTLALRNTDNDGFNVYSVSTIHGRLGEVERIRVPDLTGTAIGHAYREGAEVIYGSDVPERLDFTDLRDSYAQGERATLLLPITTAGQCTGVLRLGSESSRAFERPETLSALRRVAQIVTTSVQNARLFNQAVNLRQLNESVLESIQQGIIVLDERGGVLSFNGFMRERYDWDERATGQLLTGYEPEFQRLLGAELKVVLEQGAKQERMNQDTTLADGTILVRNFYVYPLRSGERVRGAVLLIEDVTDRLRLEETMEQRANQLAALTEVSTRIASMLEHEDIITLALSEMGWLIAYDTMSFWRRQGSQLRLVGRGTLDGQEAVDDVVLRWADYPHLNEVVREQHIVALGEGAAITQPLPGEEDVQSWLGVPLISQGNVTGVMILTDDEFGVYDNVSDQNLAQAFASQVAIALANADLFEETFDRSNELSTLLEATKATSLTQDLDGVFKTVVELMFSTLDVDDCAILTWYEVAGELEVQVDMNRHGDETKVTPRGTRLDLAQYPARLYALRKREPVVITIEDNASPFPEEVADLLDHGDAARLIVPLVVREQAIGLLMLEQRDNAIVTQQRLRMATALGAQVAIAIQNAQLTTEMSNQYTELMTINELSRTISGTLDLEGMLDVVGREVPPVTQASELYVALYDDSTQEISFPLAVRNGERFTIPPRQLNTDEVSFIIKQRRPLTLGSDYFKPDDLRKSLGITNGEGDAKSYLGQPIVAGNKVVGVMAVRDAERTRAFDVNDSRILEIVSSQLGAALQNARLFNQISNFAADLEREVADRTIELEQERDRIGMLYQITSELATTLDMDTLLGRALGMIAKAVEAQDGAILLIDSITDQLYSRSVLDPDSMVLDDTSERAIHPAESLAQWLVDEDEGSIVVDDLHDFAHWDKSLPGAEGWRSALAVLLEANNDLHGVMVLLARHPDAFGESASRLVVAAGNQVAAAIDKADLYQLIRDQAERLRNLLRAEQEEAEKNASILEGIADGVILADTRGVIIRFNPAAERIMGISRDQAIGQTLAKVTGLYGGSAEGWATAMEAYHADGAELTEYIDERLTINDKIVSVHLSPVYTGDKFLGTVSVFRDITRDVEVDRIKSDFISSVSHEFRTPLTPIKGYVDLLLMGAAGEVPDAQKRIMQTVKENVERLTLLVEDVLNISQIDSGRERLQVSELDLNECVTQALETLKVRHGKKQITVTFDPVPGLPLIEADEEKVARIFSNILDNAYKYTERGGHIDITLKTETARKHVLMTVQDTGVGIPEAFRDKVFRRFERHDDTALSLDVAGTGLGMPIAKELVDMHGGDIWLDSEEGVGTTFYISLPITQPEYRTATYAELAAAHAATNGSDGEHQATLDGSAAER